MMKKAAFLVVMSVLLLVPVACFGSSVTPGAGGAQGMVFDEGIVYSIGLVYAGDEILCESPNPTCSTGTATSGWSDVLVFYNSAKGPFVPDSSPDANSVYVFSDDNTDGPFGGLANFLANYKGLSSNAGAILENPTGLTNYNGYLVNSPESTGTPEPVTYLLAGPVLLGLGLLRKRYQARQS